MAFAIEGNIGGAAFRKVFLNEQAAEDHADTIADDLGLTAHAYQGTFETDEFEPVGSWDIVEAALSVKQTLIEHFGEDQWDKQDHLFTVHAGYYVDRPSIYVNRTEGRDAHGYDDAITISNYRVLSDRWEDLEGLWGGHYSNCDVIALELDKDAPNDLIEVLEALGDYPVLDEQEWSTVEQEQITEHWESYGQSDLHRTVEQALNLDDLPEWLASVVDEMAHGAFDLDLYPEMIDASMVEFHDDDIAAWLSARLGTVVTIGSRWRAPVTIDLRSHKLAAYAA